jgi:hypothetical protein
MKALNNRLLDAQTARENAEEQVESLTRDLETAVTSAEEHKSHAEKLEVRWGGSPEYCYTEIGLASLRCIQCHVRGKWFETSVSCENLVVKQRILVLGETSFCIVLVE